MKRSIALGTLLVGSVGLAACAADTTAPTTPTARSLAPSDPSRQVVFKHSSNTFTFAVTACNPETVLVTDRQTLFTFFADTGSSSLAIVVQTDMLSGIGQTTHATYTGTFINANASLITPGVQAFTTVTDSDLVTRAKGVPNTYVDLVTVFAVDKRGNPIVANTVATARCTAKRPASGDDGKGSHS